MKPLTKAIRIAERVRERCEFVAMHTKGYEFSEDKTLYCMCGIASVALSRELRRNGIRNKIVYGDFKKNESAWGSDHCWVGVEGHVIDITATQFGDEFPSVMVEAADYSEHYDASMVVRNIKDFFRGWEPGQRPHKRILKKILTVA